VDEILEAEALRGQRHTFAVRAAIGAAGIVSLLGVWHANRAAAMWYGIGIGVVYLTLSLLGYRVTARGYRAVWLRYAGVLLDMTVVTAVSACSLANFSGAYEALLAPVYVLLYVMFSALTALQYSAPLSLFAGVVAGIERAALLAYTCGAGLVVVSEQAVYGSAAINIGDQVMAIVFIAVSGCVTAWASRNSRRLLIQAAEDAVRRQQLERRQAQYRKYLSAQALDQLAKHPNVLELGGQRGTATVLYCDTRDFAALSDRVLPESAVEILNTHLSALVNIVFRHGGTLDKFSDAGVIAVFGLPYDLPDPSGASVRAALEMHEQVATWNATERPAQLPPVRIGIGIARGVVIAGNVGSPERMEYTVVGRAANQARVLQRLACELDIRILVNEAVHDAVRGEYWTRPAVLGDRQSQELGGTAYAIELATGDRSTGDTLVSAISKTSEQAP
jgi:class 3 adenylate cyclase